METLRLNVSEVQCYRWCPTYHFWNYVIRRRKAHERSAPLEIGTLVHQDMECVHKGGQPTPIEERYLSLCAERQLEPDSDSLRACTALTHWLAWYYERHAPGLDLLGVELELEADLRLTWQGETPLAITLFGKLDALERWEGRLWHRQIKTMDYRMPLDIHQETIRYSLHELAYAHLVQMNYPQETYGGTRLVTIRKAPLQKREANRLIDRDPEECVHVESLPIEPAHIARALDEIKAVGREILSQRLMAGAHSSTIGDGVEQEEFQGVSASSAIPMYSGFPSWPKGIEQRDDCRTKNGYGLCGMWNTCKHGHPIDDDLVYEDFNPLAHYQGATA